MSFVRYVAVLALVASTLAQYDDYEDAPRPRPAPARLNAGYSGPNSAPKPTPVAILKQINRHNEDGSYTYGYESADGTFKIETKLPTGEVKGKYGYVDDVGKVRVIEYGATKYGFEPSGEGITVPPPTLVDESANKDGSSNQDYQGSYYDEPAPAPIRQSARPRPQPRPQPEPSFESYPSPQSFQPAPKSSPVPPRPQIAGSAPAPIQHNFEFDAIPSRPAPSRSFGPVPRQRPVQFAPAPIEEQYEPAPRPSPKITYAQPAPQFGPQERPAPSPSFSPVSRPAPSFTPASRPSPSYSRPSPVPSARGGGILDQLSRDYALPDSSAPLHDISFGYY